MKNLRSSPKHQFVRPAITLRDAFCFHVAIVIYLEKGTRYYLLGVASIGVNPLCSQCREIEKHGNKARIRFWKVRHPGSQD